MGKKSKVIEHLKRLGEKDGFRVVTRKSDDYEWGREISNARIHLRPLAIVLPKAREQVKACLEFCAQHQIPFRVRSGGHHHEGMSSLNDGIVIRLSEFNKIERVGTDQAWIGVGKPLKDVYDELKDICKVIPGGGCQTVNIGGLTLGGGWGSFVRKLGLTCDNIEKAEIVVASTEGQGKFKVIEISKEDPTYSDLFWALQGGGGGNFGIVTRFLFKLSDIGYKVKDNLYSISTVRMHWKERYKDDLVKIVKTYLEKQADFPAGLTTSMGLRAKHHSKAPKSEYFPISFAGKFYGPASYLKQIVEPLSRTYPHQIEFKEEFYKPKSVDSLTGARSLNQASYGAPEPSLSKLINDFVDAIHLGPPAEGNQLQDRRPPKKSLYSPVDPPGTTCSDPWPHKISSGFPRSKEKYCKLAEKMIGIIYDTNRIPPGTNAKANYARLYMVLHSLPGEKSTISPTETAFYWREKEFIIQFQAWWSKPNENSTYKAWKAYRKDAEQYIKWIRQSREKLNDELEGAFINFVDKDIEVKEYYGKNYKRLQTIKKKYDPHNVFHFPMGIQPLKGE